MTIRKRKSFALGCWLVGIAYAAMAGSVLLQGVTDFMGKFGLPEATLGSPHYEDAILWHFYDMFVLGVLITTAGFANTLRFQRVFCVAMLLTHVVYLYLDLRTSDTVFGNGLYQGPASAVPAAIVFGVTLVFLFLTISAFSFRKPKLDG